MKRSRRQGRGEKLGGNEAAAPEQLEQATIGLQVPVSRSRGNHKWNNHSGSMQESRVEAPVEGGREL